MKKIPESLSSCRSSQTRSWSRFSLRSLLVVMGLIALLAAWRGGMARHNYQIASQVARAEQEGVGIGTAKFVFGEPLYFTTSSTHFLLWFAVDDVSEVQIVENPLKYGSESAALARRGVALEFSGMNELNDDAVEACVGWRTRHLTVESSTLASDFLARLPTWRSLDSVDIECGPLLRESLRGVARHPTLKRISLQACAADLVDLEQVKSNSTLEEFSLTVYSPDADAANDEASAIRIDKLQFIRSCSRLKVLNLLSLTDEEVVRWAVERFPELTHVTIYAIALSDESVELLLALPRLEELSIATCQISSKSRSAVQDFKRKRGQP